MDANATNQSFKKKQQKNLKKTFKEKVDGEQALTERGGNGSGGEGGPMGSGRTNNYENPYAIKTVVPTVSNKPLRLNSKR